MLTKVCSVVRGLAVELYETVVKCLLWYEEKERKNKQCAITGTSLQCLHAKEKFNTKGNMIMTILTFVMIMRAIDKLTYAI
ncbi:hypothetical protein BgiBS90_000258 [Biomphalaria glabrata]|nr:hypothetical protein BgiBS90_000258 [Biomphalaria glabrata]